MNSDDMSKVLKVIEEYKGRGITLTENHDGIYRCEHPLINFEYKIQKKKMVSIRPL